MENASKALVMAGGVLITILVVSLFILFVNQVSDFEKSRSDEVKDSQLASFNEQFTQYARNDLKGVDLISLINKVIDYNSKGTGAGEIDYNQKITLNVTIGKDFRDKYATDSDLELFKEDTYVVNDNNSSLVKVVNAQRSLESQYSLKNLDKMSSNFEALKTYYNATPYGANGGKSLKEITGKDYVYTVELFNDIERHREYSEFKTAKFTIIGEPEYIKGQVSAMSFKYKK